MEILKYPNPILLKKSEPAVINKELQNWIQELILFGQQPQWALVAGLAAPQVGRNIRVFLAQGNIYINPILEPIVEDGMRDCEEGCFSLQEKKIDYKTKRWNAVWLTYFNIKGKKKRVLFRNFPAQVIQHEYDHLEGKLCCGDTTLDIRGENRDGNVELSEPIYDPFELFQPSKTFLRLIVKQLKNTAYDILNKVQSLRPESGSEYLCEQLMSDHARLCARIKSYEWRISDRTPRPGITPEDVMRAKQYPIQDFYHGSLRRQGKTLVGLCPFHEDKHPSFTIFKDAEGREKFKCFSCGIYGDTIDFVAKTQNLKFYPAIKYILKI